MADLQGRVGFGSPLNAFSISEADDLHIPQTGENPRWIIHSE